MLCNICTRPELTTAPDGVKTDSSRSHSNNPKPTKGLICSRCTSLLSRFTNTINWEMNWEGLKALVNEKPKRPMVRTK